MRGESVRSWQGDYLASREYDADVASVHAIWSPAGVVERAGVFIFLTYLTMPVLTMVRSDRTGALARSSLDGATEREFLVRVLGLEREPPWNDGIRNPHVRQMVWALGHRHRTFSQMRVEYLAFMAQIIAIAPLVVSDGMGVSPAAEDRSQYWRYFAHAMSLMSVDLPDEGDAVADCRAYVESHADRSDEGTRMIQAFAGRHPCHVQDTLPVVFAKTRSIVSAALRGSDVGNTGRSLP
jgi:hypothetical protein